VAVNPGNLERGTVQLDGCTGIRKELGSRYRSSRHIRDRQRVAYDSSMRLVTGWKRRSFLAGLSGTSYDTQRIARNHQQGEEYDRNCRPLHLLQFQHIRIAQNQCER